MGWQRVTARSEASVNPSCPYTGGTLEGDRAGLDKEVVRSLQLPEFGQSIEEWQPPTFSDANQDTCSKEKTGEAVPFVLSEALLYVVSGKLVRRILRAEYVDMA